MEETNKVVEFINSLVGGYTLTLANIDEVPSDKCKDTKSILQEVYSSLLESRCNIKHLRPGDKLELRFNKFLLDVVKKELKKLV